MSETELRKRQAQFTRELHGDDIGKKTGLSALMSKNNSAQRKPFRST